MKKLLIISLWILWATFFASFSEASPLDLSAWTHQDWDIHAGQNTGNWQVLRNHSSYVYQANSAAPNAYLNGLSLSSYTMEGSFKICTPALFGSIGFIFGYQDPSHFYLFEWKIYNAQFSEKAGIGFAVKKFFAPSPHDLTPSDFWSTINTEHMQILAQQNSIYDRLSAFSPYSFQLSSKPGFIRIKLRDTNKARLLWDVGIEDNAYHYGQFGFYNSQQSMAAYYGFDQEGGILEPPSNGNEVPATEPGTALLLGPPLAMFLLLGRRLRARWLTSI